jgi:hypothetical protein
MSAFQLFSICPSRFQLSASALVSLAAKRNTLQALGLRPEVGRFWLAPKRAVVQNPHRRGQPLQSEAPNAKTAPESAICGVLRKRLTPTGSVLWLIPIPLPKSAALQETRQAPLEK